jgi:glycosyltransferase involved in cell wall biosynthesis
MRILFLYTELADYTLACLRLLKDSGTEIFVIHYPVNPEAPFRLQMDGIGRFISVKSFADYSALRNELDNFNADCIVCSGWINKWYLKYCRQRRKNTNCILTLDNHWNGSLKQKILQRISQFTVLKIFHKIWVPGIPQVQYARNIGFDTKDIVTGFYSCDLPRFDRMYQDTKGSRSQKFPHRFLCVARYIPAKNYEFLWNAFIKWKETSQNDWELWCAGTGELFDQRVIHPSIRHLGFVQKDGWESVIRATGVFVLASHFEPWGVVVHEFAAAGYPLLISNKVGAATEFLSAENGSYFDPHSENELIHQFEQFSIKNDEELCKMGLSSNRQAQKISPQKWVDSLFAMNK